MVMIKQNLSQPAYNSSNLTIEILEQGVKYDKIIFSKNYLGVKTKFVC